MKLFFRSAVLAIVAVTALPLLAAAGSASRSQDAQAQSGQQGNASPAPQNAMRASGNDRGQQVFDQNCSRCHLPPEGFSPRISGTVALHMRVRANLSEQDYKALLHFLNP